MSEGADTRTDQRDRRAPIVASCRLAIQSAGFRGFRQRELEFDEQLEALKPDGRRQVRSLLGRLAAQWIGSHGPSHRTLVADVAMTDAMLRVDVFSDPPMDDPDFWEELVGSFRERLATRWAIDRRRSSGVWFGYLTDG